MTSRSRQLAVELLRKYSDEAGCTNKTLLRRLKEEAKREGEPLPHYGDEYGSLEERTLLPTPETLKAAIEEDLLRCICPLCRYGGDEYELPMLDDESKLRDYATLILCGCLFITTRSAFSTFDSLSNFVYKYPQLEPEDYLRIFGDIAPPPSKCICLSNNGSIRWSGDSRLENLCNNCRWKAFVDAYELKSRIVTVYELPGRLVARTSSTRLPDILSMSANNLPFYHQKWLKDIKTSTISLKFYSCEIHPYYNKPKPNKLQGVEIFRKVYAYQWRREETKVKEAKREAQMARAMSEHDNIAPLLFAFSHKNSDFEVIELLYKRQQGNLEELLLKSLLPPDQLKSISGPRIELLDNFLWRAMVEIVEAIDSVHSTLKSFAYSPLDIKPANILVDMSEQGEFRGLCLTDFGHLAETTPRRATIEYAPPLPATEKGIGRESPMTYDVWSLACMLLEVLVFIDGDCKASELDEFNSDRQQGFNDAAFWTDEDGKTTLKDPVVDILAKLQKHNGSRTVQVVKKIAEMFSIDPQARDKMESCLQLFKRTKYTRWPEDQDHMMCGCEKWMVEYRIGTLKQRHTAKLAVYRDSKTGPAALMPSAQRERKQERISIELNLGGKRPVLDENECRKITFAPSAFWETEQNDDRERDNTEHDDKEAKDSGIDDMRTESKQSRGQTIEDREGLWFNDLHENHTFLFPRAEEYRKFVTLVTRQQIKTKISSSSTEFRIESCTIEGQAGQASYVNGNVQLWYLLPEQEYDSQYKRTSSSPAISRRSSIATLRPNSLTDWKLMFWMHHSTTDERVCVVVDIGESTWKLDNKPGTSQVVIKQIHMLPLKPKIRAAIFHQQTSARRRTPEEYPFIPIDAVELHNSLKEKVVKKMEVSFSSSQGK